jgi:hypothetical protein
VRCEFGYAPEEHPPAYACGSKRPNPLRQDIMWVCDNGHHHIFDLLDGAGQVVKEARLDAPQTGRYIPDIAILDTHYQPSAFVEIVYKNRRSKVRRAAEELGIPVFSVLAPGRKALQPSLHDNRPWWESTDMPEEIQRQAAFMQEVSDEIMGRNGQGASGHWSELETYRDETTVATSFRGSAPDFSDGSFPMWGRMVLAEWCSWDCETAWRVQEQREERQTTDTQVSQAVDLCEQLGRAVLDAMHRAGICTARTVVPLGELEAHIEISLRPLNPNVSPDDPTFVRVFQQLREAEQRVRERWERRG